MRRDPASELARAIAFERAISRRCADRTEGFRWGMALFASAIPEIWGRNLLLVEKSFDDISATGLVAEAERVMAPRGCRHRMVVVDDATVGARVAPHFRELGWEATELVWMVHRRTPERTSTAPVDELAGTVHIAAKREFYRRNSDVTDDEVLRQLRESARLTAAATDKRCFGTYVGDTVAAVCELYSDGLTAQIENVGTLEEYRGRGLASAVTMRALQEAQKWGHEMVFLVADNEDWPKTLYEKLGFDPIGRTYEFLLKPPGPPETPD